jgi:16S rRNA C967 or C1407 C5-methylase (RsmB/RsmF family)
MTSKLETTLDEYYERYNLMDVAKSRMMFRFVRLNPRFDCKETLVMLQQEINMEPYPIPVPWMNEHDFYALPSGFSLRQSECYQQHRIYGQDVSSGAAVAALLTSHHDQETEISKPLRVLDMCCCPGLKLCMMADILRNRNNPDDVIWGVDNSQDRMSLCKRIVRQYQISENGSDQDDDRRVRIRLFCNDGTTLGSETLNLVFDSIAAEEEQSSRIATKRKRINKSARAREQKRLKQLASSLDAASLPCFGDETYNNMPLFDRVLVDAECSTDGSIVHVQQRMSQQQNDHDNQKYVRIPMLTDKAQLDELVTLQKGLALSGYKLLKPGGIMVYATCSLSEDQNEGVIQWLFEQDVCSKAKIIPVKFESADKNLVQEGTVAGTIRFIPNVSINGKVDLSKLYGGGFFLAKIQKMS